MSLLLLGAGGSVSVPVPPSSFTPASIYGLERWYYQPDVDYAAGTWVDRAVVALNLTQATAGKRPALGSAIAELNGKYAPTFDGADDVINTAAFALPQPFTIVSTLRQVSWTSGDFLWDLNSAATGTLRQITATPRLQLFAGLDGPFTTALPVGRFGAVAAITNGAASILRQDGAAQNSPANTFTNTIAGLALGASATDTLWANVQFSEFMLYRGVVGAYDLVRLWNEWIAADRYNIPVTFLPTSITGCHNWYAASAEAAADGDAVGTMTDQSGNARNLTQGTAGNKPTYKEPWINGRQAYSFDGGDYVQSTTAAPGAVSALTMVVAFRRNGGASLDKLVWKSDAGDANGRAGIFLQAADGNFYAETGTGAQRGVFTYIWDTNWHILVYRFDGSQAGNSTRLRAFLDGAEQTLAYTGTIPAALDATTGLGVGAGVIASDPFLGEISEVIVYNAALTDAQRQQVEGYLANKYAINAAIRPFDPLSIAGCKGWWRVDGGCDVSADGSGIGTIYDRSGNGAHLIQATAGKKPTYETAEINGKAVARFDGSDDTVTAAFTLTNPFTCFAIYKPLSFTSTDSLFGGSAVNTGVFQQITAVPQYQIYNGSFDALANTPVASVWNQLGIVWNGASSKLWLEGVSETASPGTSNPNGITLGSNADTQWANVEFAEFIVYQGALADADVQSILAYLAKYYNIAYKAPNHSSLLANLKLWLDSSQIPVVADGTALSTWPDSSGNGQDVVQATGANQPLFETLEQNGRPGVDFDASNDNLANTGFTAPGGATAATVFVICRPDSLAVGGRVPVGGDSYKLVLQFGFGADTTLLLAADGSNYGTLASAIAAASTRIWSYVYNGAGAANADRLKLWRDGVAQTLSFTGTIPASLAAGNGWWVGARNGTSNFFDGKVFVVVYFDTVLSDADRRAVENYMAQQLNIAV